MLNVGLMTGKCWSYLLNVNIDSVPFPVQKQERWQSIGAGENFRKETALQLGIQKPENCRWRTLQYFLTSALTEYDTKLVF